MKKKLISPLLFSLFSFYFMSSCKDDDLSESLRQIPFYIMATNGAHGKISPYGIIKMRENHPVFDFIPDRGYQIDSLIVNNVNIMACGRRINNVVMNTAKEELILITINDNFNTVRVTFKRRKRNL